MGSGGHHASALIFRQPAHGLAQVDHLGSGLLHVVADHRADFHHGLKHLLLDLVMEEILTIRQNLGYGGAKVPRLRVDDLKLLFDPNRELGLHHSFSSSFTTKVGVVLPVPADTFNRALPEMRVKILPICPRNRSGLVSNNMGSITKSSSCHIGNLACG
jgi:hypothetical protein